MITYSQEPDDNPTYSVELEELLVETLNKEIVRETLLEVNPSTDDALVDKIWASCKGNPWNAVPLYQMLILLGDKK